MEKKKYNAQYIWFAYNFHTWWGGPHHPCVFAGVDLDHHIKVWIAFYRCSCQVLLKYLCRVETIHFQEILFFFFNFSNICCEPWSSRVVWLHLPTITVNSNPNNCSKLWPVNPWACEKTEKEASRGGMLRCLSPRAGTDVLWERTSLTRKQSLHSLRAGPPKPPPTFLFPLPRSCFCFLSVTL